MKKNNKYIAIGVAIRLISNHQPHRTPMSIQTLYVPMAEEENSLDADPAQILFNVTWGHFENLASPLVEWSPDGQI